MKKLSLTVLLIGVAGLLFSCAARSPWSQGQTLEGLIPASDKIDLILDSVIEREPLAKALKIGPELLCSATDSNRGIPTTNYLTVCNRKDMRRIRRVLSFEDLPLSIRKIRDIDMAEVVFSLSTDTDYGYARFVFVELDQIVGEVEMDGVTMDDDDAAYALNDLYPRVLTQTSAGGWLSRRVVMIWDGSKGVAFGILIEEVSPAGDYRMRLDMLPKSVAEPIDATSSLAYRM